MQQGMQERIHIDSDFTPEYLIVSRTEIFFNLD